MDSIGSYIQGDICILDLGAVDDALDTVPESVQPKIRAFFVDAGHTLHSEGTNIRLTPISDIVTPFGGTATIFIRQQSECSSVPDIRSEIAEDFGLEEYVKVLSTETKQATTIKEIANKYGVNFDYIKTDIEGLDGPVMMSLGSILDKVLVAKMELRFFPVYLGEPFFDEVVRFMRERNFEFERVDVEHWRYNSKDCEKIQTGRSVHADVIFVMSPNFILEKSNHEELFIRQIIILVLLGRTSYAQHLMEKYLNSANPQLKIDINAMIAAHTARHAPPTLSKKIILRLHRLVRSIVRLRRKPTVPPRRIFPLRHVAK